MWSRFTEKTTTEEAVESKAKCRGGFKLCDFVPATTTYYDADSNDYDDNDDLGCAHKAKERNGRRRKEEIDDC